MAKNYPRMQTFFIFIICVIVVAGFAVFVKQRSGSEDYKKIEGLALNANNSAAVNNSGNVGTSTDWQKQFLQNGTPIELKQKQEAAAKAKPLSLTDKISQDLFLQYWQIHQAGLESDPAAINSVLDKFSGQIAAVATPTSYTSTDLKIIVDTAESSAIYAKSLVGILKKIPTADAATIANDALSEARTSSLSQIDPIIKNYKISVEALKGMKVPVSFQKQHLSLLNAVSMLLFNAEALRKVDVDPLKGLAAISIYVTAMEQLSNALNDLQIGFNNAGIVFVDSSNSTAI